MVVVVVLVVVAHVDVAVVVTASYVIVVVAVVVDFCKRQFLILLPQNYCFPQKWSKVTRKSSSGLIQQYGLYFQA